MDRRIKLTKKIFHETLVELLQDKPLSKVTIREICEAADMNRSTFYAHYQCVEDLYKELEDDFLAHMVYNDNSETPQVVINKLTGLAEYLQKHKKVFFVLMDNGNFNNRCAEYAKRIMDEKRRDNCPDDKRDGGDSGDGGDDDLRALLTGYSVVGNNALFREWLESRQHISAEQIADIVYKTNRSISGILDKK